MGSLYIGMAQVRILDCNGRELVSGCIIGEF
jgi:hypothetical protein